MSDAAPFPILDVSDWTWTLSEPMGKPGKRWLLDDEGRSWLWKPVTVQREATVTFLKGEHWSEKLAGDLARMLGIPAAEVQMASRGAQTGVVLANVVPPDGALVHGNELLPAVVDGYGQDVRQEVSGYTLDAIARAFDHFSVGPPGDGPDGLDALGVFVEYLALDALIGNTDRHHTNWGVIRSVGGEVTLCPSYDHATSLGFQLSDAGRLRHLDEAGGVARYAGRARSRAFEGRPALIDLLGEGLRMRPAVAAQLAPAMERLVDAEIVSLVGRVPVGGMSHPCRTFVEEMLITNRRRIVDVCR